MESQELLEKLIADSKWSKARLSAALGFNNPQGFQKRFAKGVSIKVGFLNAVLSKLNYKLYAIPDGMKPPKGAVEIEDAFSLRKDAGGRDE